jgi:hypothetical protein
MAGRTASIEMDLDGVGPVPELILDRSCRVVTCQAGESGVELCRRADRLVPVRPVAARSPVRLRYRFDVVSRQVVAGEDPRLARPVAAFDVTEASATATGGAGAEWAPPAGPGMPHLLAWPDGDAPGLHVTVRTGVVAPRGGLIAEELASTVDFLAELIGPVPDTTVVALTEPGVYARSRPGLVTVHDRLLGYVGTLATQFLPHELSHQWFGNRVRFVGAGFLWGQECLPEAIQQLYLRSRTPPAVADRVARRYVTPDPDTLLSRLFTISPRSATSLSFEEYHRLLAAGTQLWLALADQIGPAGFRALLRDFAVLEGRLTLAGATDRFRAVAGARIDSLLPAAVPGRAR